MFRTPAFDPVTVAMMGLGTLLVAALPFIF